MSKSPKTKIEKIDKLENWVKEIYWYKTQTDKTYCSVNHSSYIDNNIHGIDYNIFRQSFIQDFKIINDSINTSINDIPNNTKKRPFLELLGKMLDDLRTKVPFNSGTPNIGTPIELFQYQNLFRVNDKLNKSLNDFLRAAKFPEIQINILYKSIRLKMGRQVFDFFE